MKNKPFSMSKKSYSTVYKQHLAQICKISELNEHCLKFYDNLKMMWWLFLSNDFHLVILPNDALIYYSKSLKLFKCDWHL